MKTKTVVLHVQSFDDDARGNKMRSKRDVTVTLPISPAALHQAVGDAFKFDKDTTLHHVAWAADGRAIDTKAACAWLGGNHELMVTYYRK